MTHPLATLLFEKLEKESGSYPAAALGEIEAAFRRAATDAPSVAAGFEAIGMISAAGFGSAKAQLDGLVLKLILEGYRGSAPTVERLGQDFRRFAGHRPFVTPPPPPPKDGAPKLSLPPRQLRG
ncbi:MAG: hypothetical protein U1E65_17345 [Myxococcota bacterium]